MEIKYSIGEEVYYVRGCTGESKEDVKFYIRKGAVESFHVDLDGEVNYEIDSSRRNLQFNVFKTQEEALARVEDVRKRMVEERKQKEETQEKIRLEKQKDKEMNKSKWDEIKETIKNGLKYIGDCIMEVLN